MVKFNLFIPFIFLTGLLLMANISMAGNPKISEDSKTDTISVNLLNQQCWSLRRTNPKSAISIGNNALKLAQQIGYTRGEAQILNYLGICYLRLTDSRTATEYFFKALTLSDSLNIVIEKGYALNNIASALQFDGEYVQALKYVQKSLIVQTQSKNIQGIAYAWMRMSDVYFKLQNFDSLLITSQKAYDLFNVLIMKENALVALKNIGRAWEGKKQFDKALNCYMQVLKSDEISKETAHDVYPDLERMYNLLNLPDQSIYYGKKWLSTANRNDQILREMAKAYALKKDWQEAFRYSQMSIIASDSVAKEENFHQIKNLQILYETRETEKENIALRVSLYKKNRFVFAFAAIIILACLFVLILLNKRVHQNRLNQLLNKKNEEISIQRDHLDELNQTKDKLFSIIAHDLRGPIGNASVFLEFLTSGENEFTQTELHENLDLLKDSLKETFKLLENLLTWALAQRGEIAFNPTKNNLYNVAQTNIDLFSSNAENKKVQLFNKLDPGLSFDFDHEMINTVIRNLINNAIKYTFEEGQITISAKTLNNNIEISIQDTGIGMDDETAHLLFIMNIGKNSTAGTHGEKGTGLGLIICKEFVSKHKGNIWVESELGKGSTFKFTLPLSHPKGEID